MWADKYRALNLVRIQSTANRNSHVSFFGRRAYGEDADEFLRKFCWILDINIQPCHSISNLSVLVRRVGQQI